MDDLGFRPISLNPNEPDRRHLYLDETCQQMLDNFDGRNIHGGRAKWPFFVVFGESGYFWKTQNRPLL